MVRPRTKLFIGELLAALPLREFNLRSKVVVFWKALLVLYVTALSVRHLSPKHGGGSPLKKCCPNSSLFWLHLSVTYHHHLYPMAWCDGVLEVAWAQISPGGTSLSLSTPMASDLRHTASALGRPATVGVEVRRRGRPFAPSSAKTMCRRRSTAGHSPPSRVF